MSTTSEHAAEAATIVRPAKYQTPLQRFLSDFFESKVATGAIIVFFVILFIAIFAPWISPQDPYDLMVVDVMDSRMPPGEKSLNGMLLESNWWKIWRGIAAMRVSRNAVDKE